MNKPKFKVFEFLKERELIKDLTNEDAVRKLLDEEIIAFYMGTDPTGESLHMGHLASLTIVKTLAEAGHTAIVLFGGATSQIGDPSGKNDIRKMLSKEEINHNIKMFSRFVKEYINLPNVIFVNNDDWMKKLSYLDFLRDVGIHFNINTMLANDCYKNRMAEGGLTFLEMGYMPIQAFDFEHLFLNHNCKLQVAGSDQWGNIVAGCELIRKKHGGGAQAVTTPLLLTSEGIKMGKTEKGAIWLDKEKTSVYEFYQYLINTDDRDVSTFLKWFTKMPIKEIVETCKKDIIEAKKLMAFEVTKLVHGEIEAALAKQTSEEIFAKGKLNADNMPEVVIDKGVIKTDKIGILDLCVEAKLASSKGEARRLIEQKGISVDGKVVESLTAELTLKTGLVVQKGKKVFIRIVLK